MMRRIVLSSAALILLCALVMPATAEAQITRVSSDSRHAIGVTFGYFGARSEDARVADDVLLANLESLAFDISDFNTGTIGGEWLIGLNNYIEAGLGVGYQRRTVPSVYRDFVNENDTEIAQDLKLRVIPFTGTVRFLPAGRNGSFQPYVGGGIAALNWRYSEAGEFVDFDDDSIFRARYVANGTAIGPVFLAGIRGPVGDALTLGGELRYQRAEGDTNRAETGLLGDKIDLGGWAANFAIHFRF